MKNNKKTIIIVSIILGVLVLTLGLTYSIFTISKTGSNSKLVVGDVYMHYKETTNSINLTNQMPLAEKYIVNPNMANQTYQEDTRNELSKCVDVFELNPFDKGSTAETYCKGTGTMSGETFQEAIDNGAAVSYLKELNIVTSDNKVNPDMVNQTYQKDTRNELSKCMYLHEFETFDEGTTAETYCKGTGTIDGKTFQKAFEEGNITNEEYLSLLKEKNILTLNVTTLPYFEFTIDGKNTTTNKDIWYEIILKHGDNLTGKTRIKDNLLKFTLTETKDRVTSTIFSGATYNDLTSKRVYVNTINRNTTTDVNITYRLYMWISNDTMICAGDPKDNCDYYTDNTPNWNDVFASIKVDVAGDFNEKSIATNESCFRVGTINDGNEVAILDYNRACGSDVIIPSTIKGYPVTVIGNSNTSVIEQLSNKNNDYKLNDLNNYQKNVNIKPTVTRILGSFTDKNLTSVVIPDSVTMIDVYAFYNNKLTNITIPDSVTIIGDYAFQDNQLTSVTIPNGVTTIGSDAFSNNQLTSVTISNGVTTIDGSAFAGNQLTSVTIGNGIQYIGIGAFFKYGVSNPNLSKIMIDKSCSNIKNIQGSSTSTAKYYPWLSFDSPYTASGVTIYGSNNEICDSF